MSERFGIGDFVNLRSKKDPVPDDPGVIVGYVVRVPGHPPWIATKNEVEHAAFSDVDRTGLNKLAHELVESAETSIQRMVEEATREQMDLLVQEYQNRMDELKTRITRLAGRMETTEADVAGATKTGRAIMQVLKEVIPPEKPWSV